MDEKMSFNRFCSRNGITSQREQFYGFIREALNVPPGEPVPQLMEADWCIWHEAFATMDDARDLADTQRDALGTLF